MKMTYPGLVLLVGVGVGLATFLYYVFTESNRENEQQHQQQYSRSRTPSDRHDDWTMASHRSESTLLNRRNSSNSLRSKEGRDSLNKDDLNNCSICQYALIGSDVTQLHPCKHSFHKDCIDELRKFDPAAVCPNCRTMIRQAV